MHGAEAAAAAVKRGEHRLEARRLREQLDLLLVFVFGL
jgi:hypothetical protein